MDIPASLLVIGALLVTASIFVYGGLILRIRKCGGKVRTENFGPFDLVVVGLLLCWFTSAILHGFKHAEKPVHASDIVEGSFTFVLVVLFLGSFMHFRGIRLAEQFGLRRVSFGKVAAYSLGLVAAAYPFVGLAGAVTSKTLGSQAKPQELVKYFLDSVKNGNHGAVAITVVMGAVFAPVAEEFIFRGYIYGVMKRHLGITAGALLSAAFFAAIHLNETSLPALFVLALCFVIAYEVTGSLLVCMAMHALFNFINLSLLLTAGANASP